MGRRKKKRYVPAVGSHLSEEQAQRYGEFISTLVDRDGLVTPDVIVENRDNEAVEDWFLHDQAKAAYQYWRVQAGEMLRHIYVVNYLPDGTEYTARAFHTRIIAAPIVSEGETKTTKVVVFQRTEDILKSKEGRAQLVERAKNELHAFKRKYEQLTELKKVFDAIDELG